MTENIIIEPTFAENEAIIEKGLTSFVEVGQALTRIRDGRQYQATHSTFEAYLRDRWQMSKPQATRLIGAAEVVEVLVPIGTTAPATEGVARELKPLAKQPEKMAEAWRETVERHGPQPTAAQTRAIVQERMPPKGPKQHRTTGPALWKDEDVLAWVKKCMKAGMTRDEIGTASRTGAKGWPGPSTGLPQDAGARAGAVVEDREARGDVPPKRRPSRSGKRTREIREQRKAGHGSDLVDIQYRIVQMTSLLESIDVESYVLDPEGYTAESLQALVDDLLELDTWMERTTRSAFARLRDADKIRKIGHLRETNGRTSEEIENGRRLADKLQRQLDQRLHAV